MTAKRKSLAEDVAQFRTLARPEGILLVRHDEEATRVLAAWLSYPAEWKRPARPRPATRARLLEWLWSGITIDWFDLAARSGVSPFVVNEKFFLLAANHLVFPDGTCAPIARALIDQKTRDLLVSLGGSLRPDGPIGEEKKA